MSEQLPAPDFDAQNYARPNQDWVCGHACEGKACPAGPDKKGRQFMGRTRGNRIVHFAADDRLVGELVPVKIERASTAVLYGSLTLAGVTSDE